MPAKSVKSVKSLKSSVRVYPQNAIRIPSDAGKDSSRPSSRGRGPASSWKHEAYTEALKRSLLESQMEREFLKSGTIPGFAVPPDSGGYPGYSGGYDHELPYSANSMLTASTSNSIMSERMLTATTGLSFVTTASEGPDMDAVTAEDFPEFRIETATDKMKVNLTHDIIVSLSPRGDGKLGIQASWKNMEAIQPDIFESRLAEKCAWFDLSGNSLKYDQFAKEEHVLGTVRSRKAGNLPDNLPDTWHSFTKLEELQFGQSCSEESTCKRGNLLRHIPPSIFSLTTLKILSFSSNNLQYVPKEVSGLVNVEYLYLDDNELLDFQPALLDLPRLRLLDLDNNALEQVQITALPRHLRTLRLKGNNIASFSLRACRNSLQHLDLSCNNLQNIDCVSFKSLTKLQLLDLSSNVLDTLSPALGKLEGLRQLYLDDNLLDHLPSSVCLLHKLSTLNLSQNCLSEVSPAVGNMTHLRELHLENNKLERLPAQLKHISRLLALCISGNKFVEIPPVVAELPYLRDLLLFNNKIRQLDMSILAGCQSLVVLGLSVNRIKTIPARISELKSIRILQLDSNRLTHLPEQLCELETLKYLSLNNNRIEYIPDNLANLANLVGLLMDSNNITEIPACIGRLSNLRVLSAKHNYIESIPDSISLLVNIELVDVCDNRLERLPTTISEMNGRVELKATHNQLQVPPQEVADKGILSIKTYLNTQCLSRGEEDAQSGHSEFETTAI